MTIKPATIRDYTWMAANMRASDRAEIMCQVPTGTTSMDVAIWSLNAREAWTAFDRDDQPAAAFGVHAMTPAGNVFSLWAWGTPKLSRTVREIERFVIDDCTPRWLAAGLTRIEARSIVGHTRAHRWLRRLGFDEIPAEEWGRDGQAFTLFYWTKSRWIETRNL